MRILVHEFVTGGGLAGQDVPASLAGEGAALLAALVADLAAIRGHRIVTTVDPRFPLATPPDVEVVTLASGNDAQLDSLIETADAVWLVAPETDRCLERLAARVERKGKALLSPGAAAIRRASDKAGLPHRLSRCGVPHPKTRALRSDADWRAVAREVGYPIVVKPVRGAGCVGVCTARDARELRDALAVARGDDGATPLLLQRYVPGVAASVSLLADGRRAEALTVNAQWMSTTQPFSYCGGETPLNHPLAERAIDVARRTVSVFPGLRGYVGVDLVLTESEAVVIELNPRLTTAYLGVRAALSENVAAMALAACAGVLPSRPAPQRHVRFTSSSRIGSTQSSWATTLDR